MLETIVFYMFAAITVGSGALVVTMRNPVHSVLFLILSFFNAAGLFVLLGAEFLAMLLVIVYVGAVAVLFLFVVMMLDVNVTQLRQGFQRYLPIGGAVGLVFLAELVLVAGGWSADAIGVAKDAAIVDGVGNTVLLGQVVYTKYLYLFQASGLVLLVAMIGAIVLTHRRRTGVKKQVISEQVHRKVEDCVELKKVEPGRGI